MGLIVTSTPKRHQVRDGGEVWCRNAFLTTCPLQGGQGGEVHPALLGRVGKHRPRQRHCRRARGCA